MDSLVNLFFSSDWQANAEIGDALVRQHAVVKEEPLSKKHENNSIVLGSKARKPKE